MIGPIQQGFVELAVVREAEPKLRKLKEATQQFESVLYKQLFASMRRGTPETSFGQSFGKEVFQDLADTAIADAAARRQGLGLGERLYRDFAPQAVVAERREMLRRLREGNDPLAAPAAPTQPNASENPR